MFFFLLFRDVALENVHDFLHPPPSSPTPSHLLPGGGAKQTSPNKVTNEKIRN